MCKYNNNIDTLNNNKIAKHNLLRVIQYTFLQLLRFNLFCKLRKYLSKHKHKLAINNNFPCYYYNIFPLLKMIQQRKYYVKEEIYIYVIKNINITLAYYKH